jgi:hypothetical protein
VLLDTGVYDNIEEDLRELAEFVDLPYEHIAVGLDYFTLFLKRIVLEWQLAELKANGNGKKVEDFLSSYEIDTKPSAMELDKGQIVLMYLTWDDKMGPLLNASYPEIKKRPFSIEKVGFQLFSGVESIYGQERMKGGQGILLNVENIEQKGYVYFDSVVDPNARGRQRPFMLGVIAPEINYFESLRVKEVFKMVASKIKHDADWSIQNCWEKITGILSTPLL